MSLTLTAGARFTVIAAFALASAALAQVRDPEDALSVGDGSGPLSDVSTNVGHDSRPVHDGAQTIGETSGGSVRSAGPVSDAGTRSMLSGPVSSISQGPMYEPRPPLSGGSMTEASAGTVKQNSADGLGTRISDPLRELGPLQEQMRARRQQAEQAALEAAAAPAVPGVADVVPPDDAAAPSAPAPNAPTDAAAAADGVPLDAAIPPDGHESAPANAPDAIP